MEKNKVSGNGLYTSFKIVLAIVFLSFCVAAFEDMLFKEEIVVRWEPELEWSYT